MAIMMLVLDFAGKCKPAKKVDEVVTVPAAVQPHMVVLVELVVHKYDTRLHRSGARDANTRLVLSALPILPTDRWSSAILLYTVPCSHIKHLMRAHACHVFLPTCIQISTPLFVGWYLDQEHVENLFRPAVP